MIEPADIKIGDLAEVRTRMKGYYNGLLITSGEMDKKANFMTYQKMQIEIERVKSWLNATK